MVKTRSASTKADTEASEVGRTQRARHERSPREIQPASTTTKEGISALPAMSSTQETSIDLNGSHPRPMNHPSASSSNNAEMPPSHITRSSVHSTSTGGHTRSSRSSTTVRAQKLALEAETVRRRVERERELAKLQAERECKLAQLETEAEQRELHARFAALEASDKSRSSHTIISNSHNSERRTLSWVSQQNEFLNSAAQVNVPGREPAVNPGYFQGHPPQPSISANAASLHAPHASFGAWPNPNTNNTAVPHHTEDPIEKLTHAIVSLSNKPVKSELVPFSGDVGQWITFKSCYERTKANFSSAENMNRLNNAVRGPAYESVASLLWTSSNPDEVVRALEQTYARPELLIAREVADLRNTPKLSIPEDLNLLANKLRNFVTTLKLLNQDDYLHSPELFRSIVIKLNEYTRARFTDFAFGHQPHENSNITKLELLSQFLLIEADKQIKYNLIFDNTLKPNFSPNIRFNTKRETIHATSSDKDHNPCSYCKQGIHEIKLCKMFLKLAVDDRWRWIHEAKACYRCLKTNPHTWNNCRAKRCGVDGCSRRHNALLHGEKTAKINDSCNNTETSTEAIFPSTSSQTSSAVDPTENINPSLQINAIRSTQPSSQIRGLLKVVPIVLEGPEGEFQTAALLDEGSTATLIDGEVAARIGAIPSNQERLRIEGIGGMMKEVDVSYVNFFIRGLNQPNRYYVEHARAIKPLGLRTHIPYDINLKDYKHLSDISEELLHPNAHPTVLIGAPDWHLILSHEVRAGKKGEPVASRTLLGWVLHGALSVSSKPIEFVHFVSDDLDDLIKSQYDIDSLGIIKNVPRHNDEDQRAVDILESSARQLNDGHYEVGLPWKKDIPKVIPDSYPQALSRLKALEKQMSKDTAFAAAFQEFISGIISKNYAEECNPATYHQATLSKGSCVDADGSIRWYLPIFGVFHPQKKKLRAVHDAAANTKGISLNKLLIQGPDLLCSLLDILFRFREGEVALNGDIREMFPQIKITPRDRNAQRFLWRSECGDIKEYRMSSMIFGAISSPFMALYIKNKNAKNFETQYPAASKAITDDHYMDDFLGSYTSASEAAKLAADIVTVHNGCGFEMRSWTSNHPDALLQIPKELRSDATSDVYLPPNNDVGVLGVKWNPSQDSLGFRGAPQISDKVLTKRTLLSNVMKVYDPLGLLMPVIIWGRILVQKLWRSGIGWDDPLPEEFIVECEEWLTELRIATNIKIRRWYMNKSDISDIQLHMIADGGEQAYSCVAYWRFTYQNGLISTSLIGSKARVSPLKPLSIPRLELQAALIATRFAQTILNAHRIKPSETIFWTDSITVLKWIRSDARNFKPFVATRLGEILETTNPSSWKWIPTSLNVADDATKPKKHNLSSSHRWFTGPAFLLESSHNWPTEHFTNVEEISPDPEIKTVLVGLLLDVPVPSLLVPDPARFSSWLRLLRATARVIQSARLFRLKLLSRPINSKSKLFLNGTTSPHQVQTSDIVAAEKMVLQRAQLDSFPEERKFLMASQAVPKESRIAKLAPVLDEDGLLRLDTRITFAPGVNEDTKSPIILDGRQHVVQLLIHYEHVKAAHGFNELVLNELRQKYWILRARNSIRTVVTACQQCRKWRTRPVQPQTGVLPIERLDHHKRPFTHTGLDYFGPITITVLRRHEKRYVALYTCLVTRAVHLEVVANLSSDAAIMSLRRFIARRGSPTTIFSDNGTNFVGAARELRNLHDKVVEEYATNHKIEWRFIPPASPFMGGAWERLVRTIKSALRGCLSNNSIKEDVLTTLLLEAEAIVNSRPLTYVTSAPNSPEAITPFHFILGSSSVAPWTSDLTDADLMRRCDWRRCLRMADQFWARWLREYLPTLRPRGISSNAKNLSEGDVVLIADSTLPRGLWPLGRVVKTFWGPDGVVRVADVQTKGGVLRRPARKLVLMQAAPQPADTRC